MLITPLILPIRISWVTILGQVQVWPGLDGLARFGWSLPPDVDNVELVDNEFKFVNIVVDVAFKFDIDVV